MSTYDEARVLLDRLEAERSATALALDSSQNQLAEARVKATVDAASIKSLTQKLADCEAGPDPEPSAVHIGVNTRYFDEFTAKVLPVKTQRIYTATQDAPSGSWWAYAKAFDTAGGRCSITMKRADAAVLARAKTLLATFKTRPTVDFYHEFDEVSASSYVADARRMSEALRDVADISWCPRAMMFREPPTNPANWYPGDDYIDVIACDGYFKDKYPYGTPETIFGPVLAFARSHSKPFSIYEWGVQSNVPGGAVSSANRAAQMDRFATWLQTVPELRDLLYWESGPPQVTNDYQFRNDSTVVAAFRRLAQTVAGA